MKKSVWFVCYKVKGKGGYFATEPYETQAIAKEHAKDIAGYVGVTKVKVKRAAEFSGEPPPLYPKAALAAAWNLGWLAGLGAFGLGLRWWVGALAVPLSLVGLWVLQRRFAVRVSIKLTRVHAPQEQPAVPRLPN